MNNHRNILVLFSLLFGLLTGCAVLRVDVDVYKGPLADEEYVQVQRLAVMAVGAKPLLIQARDILGGEEYAKKLINECRYKEKYIPDRVVDYRQKNKNNDCSADILDDRAFVDESDPLNLRLKNARLINSILSFYDDNAAGELKNIIDNGRYALDQFNGAWGNFEIYRGKLEILLKKNQKANKKPQNYRTYSELEKFCTKNTFFLSNKFSGYLYTKMVDKDQVKKDVEELVLKKGDRKRLINLVLKMVDQFRNAWTAQRELFRMTLQGIILSDKDRGPASTQSKLRLESAIDLVIASGQWKLMYRAIGGKKESIGYKKELKKLILQDPAGTATKLLSADAYLADNKIELYGYCINNSKCNTPVFCETSPCEPKRGSRKFGLIFQPKGGDNQNKISELANNLDSLFNSISKDLFGLEDGRLPQGISTLIQLYLDSHKKDNQSNSTKQNLANLTDVLIRFAEKLLYLSQNSAYIDIRKNIRKTYNSSSNKSQKFKPALDEKDFENIFGIIEVVGNSILVQANELIARKNHKKRMNQKYLATKLSIENEFIINKHKAINRILASIDAKAAEIKPLQKKLAGLAQSKTSLEKELKNLITTKDKLNKEKNLRKQNQKNIKTISMLSDADISRCVTNLSCGTNKKKNKQCKTNKQMSKQLPSKSNKCTQVKVNELNRYTTCIAKGITTAKDNAKLDAAEKKKTINNLQRLNQHLQAYSQSKMCSIKEYRNTLMNNIDTQIIAIDHSVSDDTLAKNITASDNKIKAKIAAIATVNTQINTLAQSNKLLEKYTQAAINIINQQAKITLDQTDKPNITGDDIMFKLRINVKKVGTADASKALSILGETNVPAGAPPDLFAADHDKDSNETDAREALDALIRWLETNRIKILHDQGLESPAYIAATAALNEAYRDRSGMNYIRPTSSYLRSSYTSTAVQQSNHLEWDNMIADSYKHSIPFLGEPIVNTGIHKSLNEIDKQFWQNINTVRVSGGGLSNYVLVKDDVGNWGVRSFTTSYEKTVAALGNMAAFNYNQKLSTPVTNKDGTTSNISPETPGLPGLFANYRKSFTDSRKNSYETLKEKLNKEAFTTAIKNKWDANVTELKDNTRLNEAKDNLATTYDTLLTPLVTNITDEETIKKADLIYDLLRTLRKYKAAMKANLTPILVAQTMPKANQTDPTPPVVNPAEKASTDINMVVDAIITGILAKRKTSIAGYEKALLFIGEATNRDVKTESK